MSPHPGTRRPPGPEPRYRRGSSSVGLLAAPVTGLPKGSVANVTQLVALDKVSPTEKVGVLPPAKLDLLLFGVDDANVESGAARRMAGLLPKGRYEEIGQGARHLPNVEFADTFNGIMMGWLAMMVSTTARWTSNSVCVSL